MIKSMKAIVIIFLAFNFPFLSYSQTSSVPYVPFSKDGEWKILREYDVFFEGTRFVSHTRSETNTYFFNGDTTLNGKQYRKIYSTIQRQIDRNNLSNIYRGAIREDEKVVYYLPDYSDNEEEILYDFTLTEGDSVETIFFEYDIQIPIKLYLDNIDTIITYDNVRRRKFNFKLSDEHAYLVNDEDDYLTSWIEGIGDIGGILSLGDNGF